MLRTIRIGSCIFVQGEYFKTFDDGRMAVRLDGKVYVGHPVAAVARIAA
jgi:hypothetical protein